MQEENLYGFISRVIEYFMVMNSPRLNLDELARSVDVPATMIEKRIHDWCGAGAEDFFKYTSCHYTKSKVMPTSNTLFDIITTGTASSCGITQDSRVQLQAMSSDEYSNEGKNLSISYSNHSTPYGQALIASTSKGICFITFNENPKTSEFDLPLYFPRAERVNKLEPIHLEALSILNDSGAKASNVPVHLKATEFQLRVWNKLLEIPSGELTTYNNIALKLGNAKAARAVGTAIGDNPVACLIPCHRVVQSNGKLGGFRWGLTRKVALIVREAAQVQVNFEV